MKPKKYPVFFPLLIFVIILLAPGALTAQAETETDEQIRTGDPGTQQDPAGPITGIPLINEDVDTLQTLPEIGEDKSEESISAQQEQQVQYNPEIQIPLDILGKSVPAGQRRQLKWVAGQSFSGRTVDVPVLVIRGASPGPTLCLTAAIHGDELNGIEIVRRIMSNTDPGELSGTLIGVPIVNLMGFTRGTRYLPDRRDLNRYFPGKANGSSAARIAYLFFHQVVKYCDRLVDFHTGSFKRTNMPQLRADLGDASVLEFTSHFGATAVLHKAGGSGTLRTAATEAGIPAVTFELGEPSTLNPEYVEFGVKAIETLIYKMWMIKRFQLWSEPQPVYYRSRWIRADRGGILITDTKIGKLVKPGDVLGRITNPLSNEQSEIRSPVNGRVLGMALNQFVLPGFASFHIGIAAKKAEAVINVYSTETPAVEDEESGLGTEPAETGAEEDDGEEGRGDGNGPGQPVFNDDDEEYH